MVHHILFAKLKSEQSPQKVEELMMQSRMRLLKIHEIKNFVCGKRIEEGKKNSYDFFVAFDVENLFKLKVARENAIFYQFIEEILRPLSKEFIELNFEMEPQKDVRFS